MELFSKIRAWKKPKPNEDILVEAASHTSDSFNPNKKLRVVVFNNEEKNERIEKNERKNSTHKRRK